MNDPFLQALASPKQPIPGGGAASAHTALVGLALLEKIVRIEHQRLKKDSEEALFWENLLAGVTFSNNVLRQLRDEDGKSYMRLVETKSSGKNEASVLEAVKQAIDCPVKIMETAHETLNLVLPTAENCKRHLLSDLQVVAELLGAASRGARRIARANLHFLNDPALTDEYEKKLTQRDDDVHDSVKRVEGAIRQRQESRP